MANLKPSLIIWLENELQASLVQTENVRGGCINQAYRCYLSDGRNVFIKTGTPRSYEAEAGGLRAIRANANGFAPAVLAVSEQALILEWLTATSTNRSFWQQVAEQLALMHQKTFPQFGFSNVNYCGATPQSNSYCSDGYEFFALHRLEYQCRLAVEKGVLPLVLAKKISMIAGQLERWIPLQPAVFIHGDLWSGNIMATTDGAKLIDPACYYGWAEAELAMTSLFGGFDAEFYRHYETCSGIDPDWRERAPLYNLYHLLNHLNLFGTGYLSSVESVVQLYGG